MRQVEIIHLRSSSESVEALSEQIRESVREAESDIEAVTLYRRRGLETDMAIGMDLGLGPGRDIKTLVF